MATPTDNASRRVAAGAASAAGRGSDGADERSWERLERAFVSISAALEVNERLLASNGHRASAEQRVVVCEQLLAVLGSQLEELATAPRSGSERERHLRDAASMVGTLIEEGLQAVDDGRSARPQPGGTA
jgi:hypothetical protein